ncbi:MULTISPECIES: DUF397 domain-containing protein [unclassified Streptomyces]|uniref:DUF397 domain-containing protein n=1 Tax=unclassified Streptomyces TaxID=2593676 RepID=UPI000BFA8558|nr:DUF397 domain-containing protein [Streptomyces sp. Ru87]PGH47039.1 DUF397 domain-containing protein [Streptomyces sp. Ru87]
MAVQLKWQKSSFSGAQGPECVEVAEKGGDTLLIRESEEPRTVLAARRASLAGLIAGMKSGDFDHRAD